MDIASPLPRQEPPHRDPARNNEDEPDASLPRRLLAEVLGTFFLTLVAAGGEMVRVISKGEVSAAAKVVAPGLLVMALIYAIGDVSGAHFNPAVTLAFALRRDFHWLLVPAYWLAQFAAAIAAALLLRGLFGRVAHVGASRVHHGVGTGLVVEILLSWLLITIILNTASRARVVGPNAAIAVGGTIVLCGLFAGPLTGPSMNPARSLGPALVAGYATNAWVYAAGPALGALIAVALTAILHPRRDAKERDAAEGDHADASAGQTTQSRPETAVRWRDGHHGRERTAPPANT